MPKKRLKKKIFRRIALSLLAIAVLFFGFYLSIYFGLWGPVPTKKQLTDIRQSQASEVYSADQKLIGKYFLYDRQPISYNDLPQHLIDALIATEDARFFEHNGIDNQSLFRVFFKTILLQDKSSGGGSTITLQLAKNLFGRDDLSKVGIVVTKIRESIIARRIEELYTKEEIIALYFNTVPFSDNTYGIESAALKFFNKHTYDLTIAEAATLVGTLKASNYYNPRLHPERSVQRRNVVLSQMERYHYLDEAIAEKAKKDSLVLNYQNYTHHRGIATYFREHLRKEMLQILDTLRGPNNKKYNLYQDGLKIYTTLDYTMQEYAEAAVQQHLQKLQKDFETSYGKNAPWHKNTSFFDKQLKKTSTYKTLLAKGLTEKEIIDSLSSTTERQFFSHDSISKVQASVLDSISHYSKFLNTGLVSLDSKTGEVKVWIGGINSFIFQYDHVAQSKRQIGSTFKPIVYAAAIENGTDPCSYYPIQAVTYEDGYTPKNASAPESDDPYLNYSMEYALSRSVNTIAVRVLMENGIDKTIEQAKKMGFTNELPEVPSLALGTAETSVLELAKAYTSFTNKGSFVSPNFITKIEDKDGNVLFTHTPEKENEPAFSEATAQYLLEMMQSTVNEGTAKRLRTTYNLQNDLAGKTGTTQDNKDGWFVGITPSLTTVVWVGHDQNIPFRSTALGQGANSALPIFAKFYQQLHRDSEFDFLTQQSFEKLPDDIANDLDCDLTKRDGLLKRIFTNPDKKKEQKKKRGFLGLFKKRDKKD